MSIGECFITVAIILATAYRLHSSVQLTVVTEGHYRVLVTIHSFVLLESRCAECYVQNSTTPQSGLCCDGSNESCPNSCDIRLIFREVERSNAGGTNQFHSEGNLGYKQMRIIDTIKLVKLDLVALHWSIHCNMALKHW